ncbi:hypothetical protein SeMB42_g07496 [Synchytrium endobioticum]|uniref:Uncharacterized protein n=1 Tax=Synchytrium endobioticum TaxID=286115 RepID=A0A507C5N7_9FUNG|nr:hypothetical protein SeMB42_g07496 [Synchytrium endobioticum]
MALSQMQLEASAKWQSASSTKDCIFAYASKSHVRYFWYTTTTELVVGSFRAREVVILGASSRIDRMMGECSQGFMPVWLSFGGKHAGELHAFICILNPYPRHQQTYKTERLSSRIGA